MEGWAIVAIVVMCVVFVAVLFLYGAIYYRFTRRFDGRVASSSTLYYWDFHRSLQSVTIPKGVSVEPETVLRQVAHDISAIYSRKDINEDNIVLARFDRTGQTYVTLDLDVLLSASHRPLFLRQTASEPLVLLHHSPYTTGGGRRASPRRRREEKDRSDSTVEPPPPQILPATSLISTETDVTITASQFCYRDAPQEVIPPFVVGMIENGLSRHPKTITTSDDGITTVVVDPKGRNSDGQEGLILVRQGAQHPKEVVRYLPGTLRYCTGDREDWVMYNGKFRLPVGRWCVRAESCSPDGRQVKSEARVYTVEDGFSSFV